MADPQAEQLKAAYLNRLRALLRRAPADIRQDALLEVQSHIEDEWQALGGDLAALYTVLQRLGPPEDYGRDLALQLMLASRGAADGVPKRIRWPEAALFLVSTSLLGAVLAFCAAFVLAYAVGMAAVAVARLSGHAMVLVNASDYQFLGYHAGRLRFPPDAWSPALVVLVGLIPALAAFAGIYRFLAQWARRGALILAVKGEGGSAVRAADGTQALPGGRERRAVLAMAVIAVLGLGGCLGFGLLGDLIPIGRAGMVSLPGDFFRSPLSVLAFVSMLGFLSAPGLGLLWVVRRRQTKKS